MSNATFPASLVRWDGRAPAVTRWSQDSAASARNRLIVERLPAYAPNSRTQWSIGGRHLKTHEIANLIATKAWELSFEATAALRRMRRRPSIITACYAQAELWP